MKEQEKEGNIKKNIYLTMQAGYVIVSISVSGYFRNTEYSGLQSVNQHRECFLALFLLRKNLPHVTYGFRLQDRLK